MLHKVLVSTRYYGNNDNEPVSKNKTKTKQKSNIYTERTGKYTDVSTSTDQRGKGRREDGQDKTRGRVDGIEITGTRYDERRCDGGEDGDDEQMHAK